MVIQQLQQENQSIIQDCQKKDDENRQLAQLVQEMERRMRKAQSTVKSNSKAKSALKDCEIEVHKMRKQVVELRDQNK